MYVDAMYDRKKDEILVAERAKDGVRITRNILPNHIFYYEDENGKYESIFGDRLSKYSTPSIKKFHREKMLIGGRKKLFESDINPVLRTLSEHYQGCDSPKLNIGLFDIETNFCRERGFAPTEDPFNNITAISIHLSHEDRLYTLVMPPEGMSLDEVEAIISKFPDTYLFLDEIELLKMFFELIRDVDVLSGWNSTGYDIPYMVNRVTRVMGMDANTKWCLWDQLPKKREYEKFGKTSITYDLIGRVHLDYLELYQKHNPQQLHSYRLDFVGEIETGENKTQYEGTLDDLYNKEFEKFIEYNRQDVMLLVKIDRKKKFIELANQIAHDNTVLLPTTMGSVALMEQALMNEAHDRGMIIPDRKPRPGSYEDTSSAFDDDEDEDDDAADPNEKKAAVGAYVAKPNVGINHWIGCVDINSLYPSAIRALNMSPETLFGHIRPILTENLIEQRKLEGVKKPDLWEGVFCTLEYEEMMKKSDVELTVDFIDGSVITVPAWQLHELIFGENSHLCISANGTIFRTDKKGLIPGILERWYSERKSMQRKKGEYETLLDGIVIDDDLANLLNS